MLVGVVVVPVVVADEACGEGHFGTSVALTADPSGIVRIACAADPSPLPAVPGAPVESK